MRTNYIIFVIYILYVSEQSTLGNQQSTVSTSSSIFSNSVEPSFTGTCNASKLTFALQLITYLIITSSFKGELQICKYAKKSMQINEIIAR